MRSLLLITILKLGLASTKPSDLIPDVIHDQVTISSPFSILDDMNKSFETQILNTDNSESITHPICLDASFKTLICRSKLFIDNSLLMNYLFHNNKTLVTLPRGFGKTISLSMLKTFFQIEIDRTTGEKLKPEETESHKIFIKRELNCDNRIVTLRDRFLITSGNHTDVMKQIGSKPVIHLDLCDLGSSNMLKDIEVSMKDRIKNSILEHVYIKLTRYESYHRKYDEILQQLNSSDVENIPKVLPNLAKMLVDIFNEKVVLLIDNYDEPLSTIFLENSNFNPVQQKKIVTLVASVYRSLLNTTSIQYVFFVGTLCWTDPEIFPEFDQLALNSAAGGNAIEFYGFAENQINIMFKNLCYEEYLAGAREYYEGYDFGAPKKLLKYNPYSINLYFANPIILEPRWTSTGNLSMLIDHLIKYANFNKMLYQVLIGGYISIPIHRLKEDTDPILSLTLDDFNRLSAVMDNVSSLYQTQWYSTKNENATIGLKVLFALGYLTRARDTESLHHIDTRREILAKIPNKEIEEYLWSQYSSIMGVPVTDTSNRNQVLYETSMNFNQLLVNLLQTDYINGKNFAIEFKKLMKAYPPLNRQAHGVPMHNNQRIIESLIETHILSTVFRLDIVSRGIQPMFNWAKQSRPDIALITREKRMVVIELKYNNTITLNQTMDEVKRFARWYTNKRNVRTYGTVSDFKLISIIVRKTLRKRVEVNVEIIPRKELEYTHMSSSTSTSNQPRWIKPKVE